MANSPIQVVLNTNNFIEDVEHQGGGPSRDFFEDKDSEFIEHRDSLSQQLNEIKDMQTVNEFAPVSYAKITLRQSALAKSHRPSKAMFKPELTPIVGAGELGELYVELNPKSIDHIASGMGKAEIKTRRKLVGGKKISNPSRIRSEIGAIDHISAHTKNDKRKFSVTEAIEWLSDPRSGGAYIIELFDDPPAKKDWDTLTVSKRKLFSSFINGLENFGSGLFALKIRQDKDAAVLFGIKLEEGGTPIVQMFPIQSSATKNTNRKSVDLDPIAHAKLLDFLDRHPLVKRVTLPPIITKSGVSTPTLKGTPVVMPAIDYKASYPKLCVVDGGVSDIFGDWIQDRWGLISPDDKNEYHGSFIAGLAVLGKDLNGYEICKENNGCHIIDLDIYPSQFYDSYYSKPLEFFNELEIAVQNLKARTGVRIFNFSLNIEEHVTSSGYSIPAQILDKIAEDNDVVFIISAGNTHPRHVRKEWPSDPVEALKTLVSARNDSLKVPAESCRNISVSALNPPDMSGIVPYGLSNYSCRGVGSRTGLKPDLAHIGGAGTKHPTEGYGLFSINEHGHIDDGCGTSYAAPNVAKTIASLENAIEGDVSRETLIALSIHHAILPEPFNDRQLNTVAKHLVGFGMPQSSQEILEGGDNAITLVFANRITVGRKLSFRFTWPSCLVKNGKCTGQAKLTIVSTPPLNYRYGSEFIRVNIDARLRQLQKNGRYLGRLNAIYTPESGGLYEKDQIEHAFKWSPIKVYEKKFPRGVGPSTDWSLDVEYLTRDGEKIPQNGVPFTAILTIFDPANEEPVFNDMRQTLQSIGVQTVDIKTAARIVSRV
ncbi:MAG: S8 family serine peptidase [Tissierellia bacterium]|nr:S8 family serine peptidase [Tissierellia bacterium]